MINHYLDKGVIEADDLLSLIETGAHPLKLVDASYGPPAGPHAPSAIHQTKNIHNAVFFDIDDIADQHNVLPHMVPDAETFAAKVSALGLSSSDFIVVYDQFGVHMAAARAWWMFRLFGHDRVCVLNGGLPLWEAKGLPITTTVAEPTAPGQFHAVLRPELVVDQNAVESATSNDNSTIFDVRSPERYAGNVPEPRSGMRAGHIPGSLNLPFMSLLNPETGRLEIGSQVEMIHESLPSNSHVISSCGSGVTACVLALAFFNMGRRSVAVYDGSWSEWGRETAETEVAKQAG